MALAARITRECRFCRSPFETTPALISIGKGKFCSRPCAYGDQFKDSGTPAALAARFTTHVNMNGPIPTHLPELGPCHVWTGATDDHGYGKIGFRGREEKAHRVAFFIAEGRWPTPCGLHRCDNPPCVRRSHLFEGSKKENTADMIAKGRSRLRPVRGEEHGCAKLSEDDVAAIRAARAAGEDRIAVAARFGIAPMHVTTITSGRAWSATFDPSKPAVTIYATGDDHYRRREPMRGPIGEKHGMAKLTADLVREIRASSESKEEIAARLSVCASTIYKIRRGASWKSA